MYQVYETISGRRRLVTCSHKGAVKMRDALIRAGIQAFMVGP